MTLRKIIIVVFALFLLVVLAQCAGVINTTSRSWNEKITLIVDTPSGEFSSFSVQGASIASTWGASSGSVAFRSGEAVMLKLPMDGKPRYLFALLQSGRLAYGIYKLELNWYTGIGDLDDLPPRVLKGKYRPRLVTFADINDPASVQQVDPDNLAASFGSGYSLKNITIEISDEGKTRGKVEQIINWLSEHPEPSVIPSISSTDFSFEAKLRHGDFVRR